MVNVFFEIHSDLLREGPGDDESTRKAYSMLQGLPEKPRVLDMGCCPGMQTIVLSKISNGTVEAVDNYQPFLEHLKRRAEEEGVSDRITTVNGDMQALAYPDGSFDLIWCEGAIYIIGFEKGLRQWRRLLTTKSYVAVSELSWLKPNPPIEVEKFFAREYPAMKTIHANLEVVRNAGYRLIGFFAIPERSWWDNYYTPIAEKIPSLKAKYRADEEALSVLAWEEREIDMFRKYSKYYGYVFYVMQVE